MNELIILLEKYPHAPWDWHLLSRNPNISLDYVNTHPQLPWKMSSFSYNPNVTLDYVLNHSEIDWNWNFISCCSGITMEDIETHLDLDWNWFMIPHNPNITMDFILKYRSRFLEPIKLGDSPKITLQDIENNLDIFRYGQCISQNQNITLDFVINHDLKIPDINDSLLFNGDDEYHGFSVYQIAKSPAVTFEDVQKHPEFLEKTGFMFGLSNNPNITAKIVTENSHLKWDYEDVFSSPEITIQDYYDYFSKYSIIRFVQNPNLTAKFVINTIEKSALTYDKIWDWIGLSNNLFQYHPYFEKPIIIEI